MIGIVHKLEKIREAKGLEKTALAKKIGIARESVYNWTDDSIKLSTFLKVCKVLETDPVQFFAQSAKQIVNEPAEIYSNSENAECISAKAELKVYKKLFESNQAALSLLTQTVGLLEDQILKNKPEPKQSKPIKT